jgi:hypothetical protein
MKNLSCAKLDLRRQWKIIYPSAASTSTSFPTVIDLLEANEKPVFYLLERRKIEESPWREIGGRFHTLNSARNAINRYWAFRYIFRVVDQYGTVHEETA